MMHFRGRGGGNNRGRMNFWRRSPSRGRGGGGGGGVGGPGGRFDRRFSPQRRYSRERDRDRRMSPMQNQFRKFSPQRRFSPPQNMQYQRRSRERRFSPGPRDRRPSSPMRDNSRDRGGGNNFSRWDQNNRNVQKPKARASSESSNWELDDEPTKQAANRQPSTTKQTSPIKNNGDRSRSLIRSRDRSGRDSSQSSEKMSKARANSGNYGH